MSFTEGYLRDAHSHCARHRAELEASAVCGCFYCLETFAPHEIEEWVPEGDGTAHCPKCWIDSVIGDASGFPVSDKAFMAAMHEFWFERTVTVDEPGKFLPNEKPKSMLARMFGWLTQKTA
ncbi:hypothetical protein [Brevundimonas sp.]|uniref:hypothetical protein n=1 Tax=Brevundimonas sp. TaxID=1871086 RepID=UPI003F72191B